MKHATIGSLLLRIRSLCLLVAILFCTLPVYAGGAAVQVDAFISGLRSLDDQPLAFGYVVARTSGDAATASLWLNRSKTLHADNPVILDEMGRAVGGSGGTGPIYADGLYMFKVYDASGTLQYSVDNLEYTSNTQPGYSYMTSLQVASMTATTARINGGSLAGMLADRMLLTNSTLSNITASTLNVTSGLATFTRMDTADSRITRLVADSANITNATISANAVTATTGTIGNLSVTNATVTNQLGANSIWPPNGSIVLHGYSQVPAPFTLDTDFIMTSHIVATDTCQFASYTTLVDSYLASTTIVNALIYNPTLYATPSAMMGVANKGYVDSKIASVTSLLYSAQSSLDDSSASVYNIATGSEAAVDSMMRTNSTSATQTVVLFACVPTINQYSSTLNGNLSMTLRLTDSVNDFSTKNVYVTSQAFTTVPVSMGAIAYLAPGETKTFYIAVKANNAGSVQAHSGAIPVGVLKMLVF